jgi:multidrug efflux pump subunit AcrA (membrane-fusion protein)
VKVGDPVQITLSEKPGLTISADVTRISGELDSNTRMLLTEIDIDNRDQTFVPGSFVQVALQVNTPSLIQIPVEGVIDRQGKSFAAVVKSDHSIIYRELNIHTNEGKLVLIRSGLNEGEIVALNLGDTLPEGSKVRIQGTP